MSDHYNKRKQKHKEKNSIFDLKKSSVTYHVADVGKKSLQ